MSKKLMHRDVCIYHANCLDGTTAATILYNKLEGKVVLYPLSYNYKKEDIEEIIKNHTKKSNLYILDFSLAEEDYDIVCKHFNSVINIDHHIGAFEKLQRVSEKNKNFNFIYDANESGASLTEKYLNKKTEKNEIIKYVRDYDLYLFENKDTEDIVEFLSIYIDNIKEMSEIINYEKIAFYRTIGYYINMRKKKIVEAIVREYIPAYIDIGGYRVMYINSNTYVSYLAEVLIDRYHQPVCVYHIHTGTRTVKMSFRTRKGMQPTALTLAKMIGGGGHEHAAGAYIDIDRFMHLQKLHDLEVHV